MVERIKSTDVEEVKEAVIASSSCEFSSRVEFLPTGNGMWNLMASGRINGGNPRARVINIVGDGSSGKTLVALEFLAAVFYAHTEALKSNIYGTPKRIRLIYTNAEGVMDFNVENMYGPDFYAAIDWRQHDTVEKFGADFFTELGKYKKGDLVIWVVDSWDALDSDADKMKFEDDIDKTIKRGDKPMTAAEKKEQKGTYNLGKQSYGSKRFFKKICADVHNANADVTLVIISQLKQKIGVTFGEKKTRTGGDALNYYTHLVIWLSEIEKMKMTRLGQDRVYGIKVRARCKRSKIWKPFRECDFKILFDYGIDDIGSMMDWYFGPKKPELEWMGEKYKRDVLYELFNDDSEQLEYLKVAIQEIWDDVESRVTPTRRKYEVKE